MSLNCSHQQAYCLPPRYMTMESHSGMILTGKTQRTQKRKTCDSATLSTTNPIWTDLCVNPGLWGERPATNCLSHGTALLEVLIQEYSWLRPPHRYNHCPLIPYPRIRPMLQPMFSVKKNKRYFISLHQLVL
jgi:hypothetical protein